MTNLFVDSFDRLTFDELKSFLGLDGPAESALREGLRIDFKASNPKTRQLDQDLKTAICRAVAALSSTVGGLIFVGVREENHFAREIVGVARNGQLKTKLDSVIRSGVVPVPRFTIGVVVVDEAQKLEAAVIRVGEGSWPPYGYVEQNGRQPIMFRSNDKSAAPALLELDALYAKRARLVEGWRLGPLPDNPMFPTPSARMVFQPGQPINILLHRGTEDSLKEAYQKHCATMHEQLKEEGRSGDFSEIMTDQLGLHRRWRGCSDGTVVFATEIVRSLSDETGSSQKVTGVALVDLAADLVNASKAAHVVISQSGPVATVRVTLDLALSREQVFNRSVFPGDRGRLTLDISSLDPKNWQLDSAAAAETTDMNELADPDRLVARLLIRVLRSTRGANINWESFSRSVTTETR